MRNELTVVGNLVLRRTRLVIPRKLCKQVLDLAHEGHQGVVKTKQRLCTKVLWPGIDREEVQNMSRLPALLGNRCPQNQ